MMRAIQPIIRKNLLPLRTSVDQLKIPVAPFSFSSSFVDLDPSTTKINHARLSCQSHVFHHWNSIRRRHFSSSDNKKHRPDPFARRPTEKCDPYGQGGKPLPEWEAKTLLATLDPRWKIVTEQNMQETLASPTSSNDDMPPSSPPQALVREFVHPDFIAGSKFVAKIAAVAQLNIHFPSISLERRIIPNKKAWQVVTRVSCHTLVLGGLSTHDFHLAMLIDVEAERPEAKDLIIPEE